jgi:hypothetical protein
MCYLRSDTPWEAPIPTTPSPISMNSIESQILSKLRRRSIVLIGFENGAIVGGRLAERLKLPFTKLDTNIEQLAVPSAARDEDSDGTLRARLFELGPEIVNISTHAFSRTDIRKPIKEFGFSVLLQRSPPRGRPRTPIDALLRSHADVAIDTANETTEQLVENILNEIGNYPPDEVGPPDGTFAGHLAWHLTQGTRALPAHFRPWTIKDFALETGVTAQTVQSWLRGSKVPADIDKVRRVLFGNDEGSTLFWIALLEAHERESHRTRHVRLRGQPTRDFASRGGMTISMMSRQMKVGLGTLRRAMNGDPISYRAAMSISKVMQIELDQLLEDEQQPTLPPFDAIPTAEQRAIQFTGSADGVIDLAGLNELGEQLQRRPGAEEDYSELRAKASELFALGSNRLGRIQEPIARFLALPGDSTQVRARLFWSRANTLRILWRGHQSAASKKAREEDPDERLLEPSAASRLEDLVETINVFIVGDENLSELDAARPGPQEIQAADEEAILIAPVVEDVIVAPDIASPRAKEVLGEQVKNTQTSGDDLSIRQTKEFAKLSLRNFVGALLRRAYNPVRNLMRATINEAGVAWKGFREGAYKAAGTGMWGAILSEAAGGTHITEAIVRFVVRHAEALIVYVTKAFQNPAVVDIINWIVRMFV